MYRNFLNQKEYKHFLKDANLDKLSIIKKSRIIFVYLIVKPPKNIHSNVILFIDPIFAVSMTSDGQFSNCRNPQFLL